ncbi:MAG: hypothetical protein V1908_04650 [Candidatus Peregrinibacteria bacterium]
MSPSTPPRPAISQDPIFVTFKENPRLMIELAILETKYRHTLKISAGSTGKDIWRIDIVMGLRSWLEETLRGKLPQLTIIGDAPADVALLEEAEAEATSGSNEESWDVPLDLDEPGK